MSPSLWGTVGVEGGGYGAVPNPPQWLCVFPPPGYGVHVAVPERFPRGAQVGGNGGQWGWWCCGAEGFGVMGGGGGTALWGGLIPPDPTRTPKQGSDGGVPRLWGGPFALGSTIWGGGPHPLGGGGHIRGGPIRRSGGVLITWGGPYLWWGGGGVLHPISHPTPPTPPLTRCPPRRVVTLQKGAEETFGFEIQVGAVSVSYVWHVCATHVSCRCRVLCVTRLRHACATRVSCVCHASAMHVPRMSHACAVYAMRAPRVCHVCAVCVPRVLGLGALSGVLGGSHRSGGGRVVFGGEQCGVGGHFGAGGHH